MTTMEGPKRDEGRTYEVVLLNGAPVTGVEAMLRVITEGVEFALIGVFGVFESVGVILV